MLEEGMRVYLTILFNEADHTPRNASFKLYIVLSQKITTGIERVE